MLLLRERQMEKLPIWAALKLVVSYWFVLVLKMFICCSVLGVSTALVKQETCSLIAFVYEICYLLPWLFLHVHFGSCSNGCFPVQCKTACIKYCFVSKAKIIFLFSWRLEKSLESGKWKVLLTDDVILNEQR